MLLQGDNTLVCSLAFAIRYLILPFFLNGLQVFFSYFGHCPFFFVLGCCISYLFFRFTYNLLSLFSLDDLISSVAKSLQLEIDSARKQKWDAVLLSQYLYELREAKKQGRKERRHREAQAVLAAATAAAAASSRISSLRKDTLEEPSNEVISFSACAQTVLT